MTTKIHKFLLDDRAEDFAYHVYSQEKSLKPVHLLLYLHILRKLKAQQWRHQLDYDLHSKKTWEALHITRNTYGAARQMLVDVGLIRIVKLGGRHGDEKIATSISIVTDRLLAFIHPKTEEVSV